MIDGVFFTTAQAQGAIRNGTVIVKVKTDKGDANPIGTKGKVLGSLAHPDLPAIGYFVEWDTLPNLPVFVVGWKIEPAP